MADIISYKCPNCGGKLEFDAARQKMVCPYCDSEFIPEEIQQNEIPDTPPVLELTSGAWEAGETEGMCVYECQSCGAQIVAEPSVAATKCPYCDNSVIVIGQFSGDLKPDYIIPFAKSRKEAVASFQKHIRSRKYVPKVFRELGHPDEIKGVYVPFWLFSADCDVDFRFTGYKTSVYTRRDDEYVETESYDCRRAGMIRLEGVPVDGSSKFDDDLMECIEPFQLDQAKPFDMAYLSGYMAERYDVEYDNCLRRAEDRMKFTAESIMRDSASEYSSISIQKKNVRWSKAEVTYALFPVWMLSTIYQGKSYLFAMNGQTGKMIGDLPVDRSAFLKSRLKVFLITAIIIAFLIIIMMMFV